MSDREPLRLHCARARRFLDARLDGESVDEAWLEAHVAGCPSCREMQEDMLALRAGLAGLQPPPMPDEVLERVLAATVRRPARRRSRLAWAAAAVILITVGLGVLLRDEIPAPGAARPTRAEMEQAASEARMVLALAGRAMDRAGREAALEVGADVSEALDRVPVDLPETRQRRRG